MKACFKRAEWKLRRLLSLSSPCDSHTPGLWSSSPGQRHNPGGSPELLSPRLLFCPRTSSRDCLKDWVIWCLRSGASPIAHSVPQVRRLNPSPSRGSGDGERDSCYYCCHQWQQASVSPASSFWFCFRTSELLLQLTLLLAPHSLRSLRGWNLRSSRILWEFLILRFDLLVQLWPAAASGTTETAKGKGTNDNCGLLIVLKGII